MSNFLLPTNHQIREAARSANSTEISHNIEKKIFSFAIPPTTAEGVLANVYYSTGTVGVILNHTRMGKTEIFLDFRSQEELKAILENPGKATSYPHLPKIGAGHHKINHTNNTYETEEQALSNQRKALDDEMYRINMERANVTARLEHYANQRQTAQEKIEIKKYEAESIIDVNFKQSLRLKRGENLHCKFIQRTSEVSNMFNPEVISIASIHSATVMTFENGDYEATDGLPQEIHQVLQENKTKYFSMGSFGRFFAIHFDKTYSFGGELDDNFKSDIAEISSSSPNPITAVSFGETRSSYFIMRQHNYSYCDIPLELEIQINAKFRETKHLYKKQKDGCDVESLEDVKLFKALQPDVTISSVSLGPSSEWSIIFSDGDFKVFGLDQTLFDVLDVLQAELKLVIFGSMGNFLLRHT